MKKINTFTFTGLLALAAALAFQTSHTRAGDNARADGDDPGVAKITFVKYVTAVPSQPGLIATMTGVGEGDAGDVLFEGNVLRQGPVAPSGIGVVAEYILTGTRHSLTVLIQGYQAVPAIGQKGVLVGVVTSGWRKGHAVEGEWTVIPATYPPGTGLGNSFAVTLKIKNGIND